MWSQGADDAPSHGGNDVNKIELTAVSDGRTGHDAARIRVGHALVTGALIATEDARKLAQELAGDAYGVLGDFGRGELHPARLAFGPVRVAFLAELDRLAFDGDVESWALRAGLVAYARQQGEALALV